jgi:hypothetical protein
MLNNNPPNAQDTDPCPPPYEVIDTKELAKRWNVPKSWIAEQVRERATDKLPHVRMGRYVRFQWQSPELTAWLKRHTKQ